MLTAELSSPPDRPLAVVGCILRGGGSRSRQNSPRTISSQRYRVESVAVGIPVARYPPHRSVRALISAYGSYLRYLAAKRDWGYGWSTRGWGIQRTAQRCIRVQGSRCFWLRQSKLRRQSRVTLSRKIPRR